MVKNIQTSKDNSYTLYFCTLLIKLKKKEKVHKDSCNNHILFHHITKLRFSLVVNSKNVMMMCIYVTCWDIIKILFVIKSGGTRHGK